MSSCELNEISVPEIKSSSRELTRDRISTFKTKFALLSVEILLPRYPKRLGLSIGGQMVEHGDKWCMGTESALRLTLVIARSITRSPPWGLCTPRVC